MDQDQEPASFDGLASKGDATETQKVKPFDDATLKITAEKPQAGKPEKTKTQIQAKLADNLLKLLTRIYIGILLFLFFDRLILIGFLWMNKDIDAEKLQFENNSKDIITLVLSTSSALAGSAIGFYFNGNSLKDED